MPRRPFPGPGPFLSRVPRGSLLGPGPSCWTRGPALPCGVGAAGGPSAEGKHLWKRVAATRWLDCSHFCSFFLCGLSVSRAPPAPEPRGFARRRAGALSAPRRGLCRPCALTRWGWVLIYCFCCLASPMGQLKTCHSEAVCKASSSVKKKNAQVS